MSSVDTQGRLEGILDQDDFGAPGAELSSAAIRVLESRYLLRDAKGTLIETPRQMFGRVSRAIASVEGVWAKDSDDAKGRMARAGRRFFELLSSLKFLPNSPTLMNAGKVGGQMSACFVLPIPDDLGAVFETLRMAMVVHKTGGGTGFSFGGLRAKGEIVSGSGGTASGPVAFLKIFDVATQTVKQGGVRRGANMAILPVSHPDIEEFVHAKVRGGIENFNLSVGIPNSFIEAVKAGKNWDLQNPRDGRVVGTVRARALWKEIIESTWACGDPGVIFLDRINADNPTPTKGSIESTNPCGEQPLLAFESCNLGSMNLRAYVENGDLKWEELEADVGTAVRFLDNVIEANAYTVAQIREATHLTRKVGLGIMGWADVLMGWGIPYDSEEACERAEKVMGRIARAAVRASETLAEERGAFPAFAESRWAARGDKPRRNATVTTVAPTGSISIIAGVSSGIEPVFALAYQREALEGEDVLFVHPTLKQILRETNVRSRRVIARIVERGSVYGIDDVPARFRRVSRTAHEIHPRWHVRMQAAFQRHVENGVSKTINLPRDASVASVGKIFQEAFALGCKGITVYRDLSKTSQVLRGGVGRRARRADLLNAVDWLLDDDVDGQRARKRVSVGLASLSRARIRERREG